MAHDATKEKKTSSNIGHNPSLSKVRASFTLHYFLKKELKSGLSLKSFRGSKLLNGCLVVWQSDLCMDGIQEFLVLKIDIYDQWF